MKVKLLTIWTGNLPSWIEQFRFCINRNELFIWELIHLTFNEFKETVYNKLGILIGKTNPYGAYCDFKPLYGQLFEEHYKGYDYWGWCDVDLVPGNLDKLVGPLLDKDIVCQVGSGISGPFTILKNTQETRLLYREAENWQAILYHPGYIGFDEGKRGRPLPSTQSFYGACIKAGYKIYNDNRGWVDGTSMIQLPGGYQSPLRTCKLVDRDLIEVPTGRELVAYHFGERPKMWPLNAQGEWCRLSTSYTGDR